MVELIGGHEKDHNSNGCISDKPVRKQYHHDHE